MTLEELIEEKGKVDCCICCCDENEHDIEDIIREAYELGKGEYPPTKA